MDILSLIVAVIALVVSGLSFWWSNIKSSSVRMTRPTVVYFGPDGMDGDNKVFIRTLLYSTSEKGRYIQNMYIKLQRNESVQNFNIWVYDSNGLVRGSGLYINKSGIAMNHHFLMPKDRTSFAYIEGNYFLQVFAETVENKPEMIFSHNFVITKEQENKLHDKWAGLYFDWAPNTQGYNSHIKTRIPTSEELGDLLS